MAAMYDNEKILEALKRIEGELRTLKGLAILWTLIAILIFLLPVLWTLLFRFKPFKAADCTCSRLRTSSQVTA
jgi:hypothetical protein